MKSYCENCKSLQPSSFRLGNDAVTGATYEDLCCDTCHFIVATVQEREAKEALAQPVQEAIYGMNQDDWKDVVAAIAKVRDGRGIYLGCRPADVFQDWFLALGTAKVKEKNNG